MVTRTKVKKVSKSVKKEVDNKTSQTKGNYFVNNEKDVKFISSGCTLLDCVLGGGLPLGRVINIVGDKSSGKTLLAIEATANFAKTYPDSKIWYNEAESAFDKGYAAALGMPIDSIIFVAEDYPEANTTVEGFFEHLKMVCDETDGKNGLYILDSLDALSDKAEMERSIDEGSYGANKAKKLSEMFRRIIRKLEASGITLIIISQIRDKIGVTFGKKTTRSGGKALDFYASIVLFLAEVGKIKKTINKVERPVGVKVKAKAEKNKVGLPYRDCTFPIMFGYGIDSLQASLDWLASVGELEQLDIDPKSIKRKLKSLESIPDDEYFKFTENVESIVKKTWNDIELKFLPTRKKY